MVFSYDPIYDKLFEDPEFIDIICKFHSSHWKNIDKKAKIEVLDSFVKRYGEILGVPGMKLKKLSNSSYSGVYTDIGLTVCVNEDAIESTSQYDVMDTLFHELRHNFQHRAVSRNLTELEKVSDEQRQAWKINFLHSPRGYSNYISTTGEYSGYYYYQPVERDAFMTGLALTKKAFEIISKRVGDDVAFREYAMMNKDRIMLYFSDEEKYVTNRQIMYEKVNEIFAEKNKEKDLEKKCMKIAKETMKKDIKEMSLEDIVSLFSVYVWAYLDDDYKISLLKEYDSRVGRNKPVRIEKESNTAFKVDGVVSVREDIGGLLNNLFSYEFRGLVFGIISGKIPASDKLKEELTVNLYKENGKKVNYIKDSDNFLLYSIQPYAIFEGKTIIEWFRQVADMEKKYYGIDNGNYDKWLDFYDNEKYIPYIEEFYEKPFEEIYNELVEDMKKNVKVIKNKK